MLVMPLAAWSVHQLRYLLAYGSGAGRELSEQGHAYLTFLMPGIVMFAALALGGIMLRFARSWREGVDRSDEQHTLRLWTLAVAGLLAIYAGQEISEGMLAGGHPAGLAAVFGNGGWLAVPAALLVGGLVALGLRGARVVERFLAQQRASSSRRSRAPSTAQPHAIPLPRITPLARSAAGRAPPSVLPAH
jgi:hypothetical protein